MITSGTFYVNGGYRPCIVKHGYKWSYVMYIEATRLACKRVLSHKLGKGTGIVGQCSYSTPQLALRLSGSTLSGQPRTMTKQARRYLKEACRV